MKSCCNFLLQIWFQFQSDWHRKLHIWIPTVEKSLLTKIIKNVKQLKDNKSKAIQLLNFCKKLDFESIPKVEKWIRVKTYLDNSRLDVLESRICWQSLLKVFWPVGSGCHQFFFSGRIQGFNFVHVWDKIVVWKWRIKWHYCL